MTEHNTSPVCYRHPDRPTGLSCTRCGRSICGDCMRPVAVGQHCPECVADQVAAVRVANPVTPHSTASSTPIVTYALIAINVLAFLVCAFQGGGVSADALSRSAVMHDGVLISGGLFDHEYWRLLTSGFLHWGVVHLAVNMLSLFIIGRDLERFFGPARYLSVYLVALLGGSGLVMLMQRDEIVSTAGASGAIYGMLGAYLILVLMLKQSPANVISIIVINLVISISLPNISLWGHVGGLIFGALATLVIYRLPTAVLSPDKRTVSSVSMIGWMGIAALAVVAVALGVGVGVGVSA